MRYEDILITPNQYLGGNRQEKRYLANPAATAFQSGNMLHSAGGASYSVDGGFDLEGNTAQAMYNQTVSNSGPIRAQDPNNVTIQDSGSSNSNSSSGGSNGGQDSGGSNGNGNQGSTVTQDRGPAQTNPVTSSPQPDPGDQPGQKSGNKKEKNGQTDQDQEQKKDSSELLYWAIPAATIAIGIGIYLYGNN